MHAFHRRCLVLRKRWKPKTVMLTLAVVGGVMFSVLTTITVLAQTSSTRSSHSQSSANNVEHRRNNVRSDSDNGITNSTTTYVENTTDSYVKKKPPLICRSRAIRTWLRWKCPKVR